MRDVFPSIMRFRATKIDSSHSAEVQTLRITFLAPITRAISRRNLGIPMDLFVFKKVEECKKEKKILARCHSRIVSET